MTDGTIENRVILPIPAAIFSPALRIHVAFDADHGRCPRLGLSVVLEAASTDAVLSGLAFAVSVFMGPSFRLGCFRGALARSRNPAELFLRGEEQIVGLVRRLRLRLY